MSTYPVPYTAECYAELYWFSDAIEEAVHARVSEDPFKFLRETGARIEFDDRTDIWADDLTDVDEHALDVHCITVELKNGYLTVTLEGTYEREEPTRTFVITVTQTKRPQLNTHAQGIEVARQIALALPNHDSVVTLDSTREDQ